MKDLPIPPLVPPVSTPSSRVVFRSYRPSLVDLRFKGDPWVVEQDQQAAVCLGDFPLGRVGVSPLDVPSLNRFLMQVRVGQARRDFTRRSQKLND